jgi:outer membrane cobalamin receptor
MASATLGWRTASLTGRYVSAQFEDDANSRRLGAAFTIDGLVALPLSNRVSLVLRGENLADKTVDTAISATAIVERATPRTLWIGVRIN